MARERIKILLDFDGTLTNEIAQAAEFSGVAIEMFASILGCSVKEVETRYLEIKAAILKDPHCYPWLVNDLPACYAYEGAYLLNTVILQQILLTDALFLETVSQKYPADKLDSVTQCVNYIFHQGSFAVNPHFLPETREFLVSMIEEGLVEPVIFTNSETRKIVNNLRTLAIGERGSAHSFDHEIGILGDTRQYFIDPNWNVGFAHPRLSVVQILPINEQFAVDLRRPTYYAALAGEIARGYRVIVVADGFSLAGAMPLMMGLDFVLAKTSFTPDWASDFVAAHPRGNVVGGLVEIEKVIRRKADGK